MLPHTGPRALLLFHALGLALAGWLACASGERAPAGPVEPGSAPTAAVPAVEPVPAAEPAVEPAQKGSKGKSGTEARAGAGWTELELGREGRAVFVSESKGKDSNNGLSEATPKKSLRAGLDLLRDQKGDWLRLKKGDTWELDGSGPAFDWRLSGASPKEPVVLTSYGPDGAARPILRTHGQTGIQVQGGRGAPPSLKHVAFVGIEFSSGPREPGAGNPNGVQVRLPVTDLLIEDCKLTGFCNGLVLQERSGSKLSNVRIRRNVIAECFAYDKTHAQGMYCTAIDGLVIEENVIDHGGWSETETGTSAPDIFKHDIYVQADCRDVVVRGNIVANGASHGLQLRTGGVCNDNLFVRNAIAVLMGGSTVGEKPSEIRRNVILEGRDISAELPRRQGIHMENIPSGVVVAENILAHCESGGRPRAFSILPLQLKGEGTWLGVKDITIERNDVYEWGGVALEVSDFARGEASFSNLLVRENAFTNTLDPSPFIVHYCDRTAPATRLERNLFHGPRVPDGEWMRTGRERHGLAAYLRTLEKSDSTAKEPRYVDPARTLGSYNATLGGAPTTKAFLEEALKQSRDHWRPGYTAAAANEYFRAGFERKRE